jgi:hypothetical protein
VSRVNGLDVSAEASHQIGKQSATDAAFARGSAEDGHRVRMEDPVKAESAKTQHVV